MLKYFITFLYILGTSSLFPQNTNCNCLDELENITKLIQNAKSYTVQIKKNNKEDELNVWKAKVAEEIKNDSLKDFFCMGYLQKYASYINDRHNEIYKVPEDISSSVPIYTKPIDTLKISNDGVSGIYHMGSDKIFLKKESDLLWYGITLDSSKEAWKPGAIRLKIQQKPDGSYELFEFYQNGILFYQKDIKIADGRIHGTFWNTSNQYFFNKNHKENFNYEAINTSFDYIGIKTLKRTRSLMKEAERFYEETLPKLTRQNLIVDLRNNGGGATKQADELLKHLKRNNTIQKVYVLINFKTGSSAELTTLALKKDPRTIIVGENSRGMLEYGYGNKAFSSTTDCAGIKTVLSTKHINSDLSKYESKGISPDYGLNNESDWLEQVIQLDNALK